MADFSIVELVAYGIIGYLGIVILMISILVNPPQNQSLAGVRSIWLTPSLLAMGMLMFLSGIVTTGETTTTITTTSNATSEVWTETGTIAAQVQLVDPVWGVFHFGMFMILIIYILTQVFNILTKPE